MTMIYINKMMMMNEGDPGPENMHDEDDDWRKRANMKEDWDEVNEQIEKQNQDEVEIDQDIVIKDQKLQNGTQK